MNTKSLFIVNGIVNILFGIAVLFATHKIMNLYLLESEPLGVSGTIMAKVYGAFLLGLGISILIGRNAEKSIARTAILYMILIVCTLSLFVYVPAFTAGQLTNMIIGTFVLLIGFGGWAAVLLYKEETSAS